MNNQVCVMVVSCDNYSDAWGVFQKCFEKYWNDCPFPCYLVNNEIKSGINKFITINTGPEISWSRKVRTALLTINVEYIVLMLEDYFLTDYVSTSKILRYVRYLKDNNSGYLSFFPVKGMKSTNVKDISLITEENIYTKVLQPSIWKKEHLLDCLFDDDFSAWEFENRQKVGNEKRVLSNDYCTNEYAIQWKNGILQGKWYGPTLRYLKKSGVDVPLGKREVLSSSATQKYQVKSRLFGIMPVKMIRCMRKVAEIIGVKFVTKN